MFLRWAPQAEHRAAHGPAQGDGPGHVAPRAPQHRRAPGDHPRHRVVAAVLDRAVVGQEQVGDAPQALARLLVLRRHRLLGQVPGGHHQGPAHLGEEEVVQRRVGEEQADEGVPRRHLVGQAPSVPTSHEDDGPLDRLEETALLRLELRQPLGLGQVAHHHREGLLVPPLALAQETDGLGAGGVARQVEAPEALDRDDGALAEARGGKRQGPARAGAGGERPPGRVAAAAAAGRSPGRRSAGRGSAGRSGPRTPRSSAGTWRTRPSSCASGRRARRGRSCSAARTPCSW